MSVAAAWTHDIKQVLEELSVPEKEGLSDDAAAKRLEEYGPNTIVSRKKISRWNIFAKQILNPMVLLLVVAAAVSFYLDERLEANAILAIVLLNCLIGYFQEAKAEAAIEALADLASPKGKVLRGQHVVTVSSDTIVPGDILIFEAGDYVVADARILKASQLATDEAVLTGESMPVDKNVDVIDEDSPLAERTNMVFAGTAISRGSGCAAVTATGKHTEIGKIASMMETTNTGKTPLQERLGIVGQKLVLAGLAVIAIVIAIGLIQKRAWDEMIMSALSLSVAAIPEGLPTIVTLALVLAVRRMARKRALVRKMDSVETLGATDIICTDKTGTLTTGKMSVRETVIHGDRKEFFQALVLCNNAVLHDGGTGDTTEIALLKFAQEQKIDPDVMRKDLPRFFEWSFDSERKRMSVAVKAQEGNVVYAKGAPESLVPRCQIAEENKRKISGEVSSFTRKGMRVLALARKSLSSEKVKEIPAEEMEKDFEFCGLVAMADPPRKESVPAIRKCQDAGIRIIMITGDHPETAGAIATELGIVEEKSEVMTGKEIDKLSPEKLAEKAETISVFARVSPENKLTLVKALRKKGHVVAMTGDGVNDAPALKAASIGVSMGKGGTEVARQASSMVLTDDNFATIVDAVEEGRGVHGNIKRTLQYLLSTNLAELLFIFTATLIGQPVPLLPIHLLWLNLVTDGLPSLALASEKIHSNYLQESERSNPASFFDRAFVTEMLVVGAIITIMAMGIYFYALRTTELVTSRSYAFNFVVYAILFRSFSCRHESKTFFQMKPNFFLLASVIVPVIFQILIQQSVFFLRAFRISALDLGTNITLLLLSLVPVTITELVKFFRQLRKS